MQPTFLPEQQGGAGVQQAPESEHQKQNQNQNIRALEPETYRHKLDDIYRGKVMFLISGKKEREKERKKERKKERERERERERECVRFWVSV